MAGLTNRYILVAGVLALSVLFGCSVHSGTNASQQQFSEMVHHYRQSRAPFSIPKLRPALLPSAVRQLDATTVTILVHPGYAVFMNNVIEKNYSKAKFQLMQRQFQAEADFIAGQAQRGDIMILILPPGFHARVSSHVSYASYVNRAAYGRSVFYLLSRTARNGSLEKDEMITLYRFLRSVQPERVLIGGGYIGRCQEEFLHQLATFIDAHKIFVVPEISTISPKDVSETEASDMVTTLEQQDYRLVKSFISDQTKGDIRFLSIPQMRNTSH